MVSFGDTNFGCERRLQFTVPGVGEKDRCIPRGRCMSQKNSALLLVCLRLPAAHARHTAQVLARLDCVIVGWV